MSVLKRKNEKPLLSNRKGFYILLKKQLGIVPGNGQLYETAFIPKSMTLKRPGEYINNARLEYLGDAVFTNLISELLYNIYPEKQEGELSKIRAIIISRDYQEKIALSMGLNKIYEILDLKQERENHLHANTLEALFGAMFLDKGYRKTRKYFLNRILGTHLDPDTVINEVADYKSLLISWCQQNKKELVFDTEEKKAEAKHPGKFISIVRVNGRDSGKGYGKSKKAAEQNASRIAWKKMIS